MFRIHADHPHNTLAVNDLALVTDFSDGCPYLHDFLKFAFHNSKFANRSLLVAINDSTSCQIVRRKFDSNLIARKNTNEILPHLS